MKTFYNCCIISGYAGTIGLAWIVSTCPLPWWKWPVSIACFAAVEFGCFAWRDKENTKL